MDLQRAERWANDIMQRLQMQCDVIEIAGSIRRRSPDVRDIEIICVPSPGIPAVAFGAGGKDMPRTRLDVVLNALKVDRYMVPDPTHKKNGPKYKRFIHVESNLAVDLFITERTQFGYIKALRTGDSRFSKQLVTDRSKGGLMPSGWKGKDGQLLNDQGHPVPVPNERAFFAAIGVPFVNPQDRGLVTAQRLHRELGVAVPREEALF